MKIVNLDQFLKYPEGTIYCKYKPCYMEELEVKGQSLETRDWVCMDLICPVSGDHHTSCVKMESGEEVNYESDYYGRDGCFDEEQMFMVYNHEDTDAMIKIIRDNPIEPGFTV
jgi:hypothetical protein